MAESKPTVAVAGATGFVGQALREALKGKYRIVGLTRSPVRARALADDPDVEWRHCDLFSLAQVEGALEGIDYAFYLVHSMMPSARLVQADFEDL
ncbi:MAG: NAD(P)H-binding protein, partial [Myxococcota bacterium]